jgi:Ser/Thr protein kinase RdoA (MazF antagonist)
VMPISELVRVARTIAEDGSSPLALRAAQGWGYDRVRFLRSSANHVFVCSSSGREAAVLRLRPDWVGVTERSRRVAELATRLGEVGAPSAAALTSEDGELVVGVRDDQERYVASLFAGVSGEQLEAESLTVTRARFWGRGLALVHEAGSRLEEPPQLPRWIDAVEEAAGVVSDREFREVGNVITGSLAELPSSPTVVGVVHGDPELDNVVWVADDTPVFVDLDDASWSWFAADICFALRDFAKPAEGPDLELATVASFIAGYRECRPLEDAELAALSLFARGHALITVARLESVLSEPVSSDWPDWARALWTRLDGVAEELRRALAAVMRHTL